MLPHKLAICLLLFILFGPTAFAQRKPPIGGRLAVVVDERLAALRTTPALNGKLVRRLGRGRLVAIRSMKTSQEGITFFLVNVSSRTNGWIQREAVVSPARAGDDQRLSNLINGSQGFDRISRARIFLDHFPRSRLRPEVLLLLGDTAEELATKLSADAARRLSDLGEAPEFSYYLNYSGLDRYNRQGIRFMFGKSTRRFHYDGAAWRELIHRYPKSPQAEEAKKCLETLYSHLRMM
ncbi:MAG TPA: hypothetical protein VEV42_09100 [Pyrinomonadaceae bacterium]|jgi:hypothetical protein|nr:hypothetical protein [Pyrinomonadaceae bacterium]